MKNKTDFPNKPFEIISSFLSQPRKKEKQPSSDSILGQKAALSILTQILTHSSCENSQKLLHLIGNIIYYVINVFFKSINTLELMEKFLSIHKKNKGMDMFSISTPTLKKYTDTVRPDIADEFLHQQINKISEKNTKLGLNRKEISLAIDPTTKEYRGKYANQCQPKGYVGQKERYPTAYSIQTICDCTNQLILTSSPKTKTNKKYKSKDLPQWISSIQSQIISNFEQKQRIKVLYGDREYYQGIGFAYAAIGWRLPSISPDQTPRICVPRKLRNKQNKKREFLLNSKSKQIEIDSIDLNYYQNENLGNALNFFKPNKTKTKYQIPVAIIATFDAYSNRRKKKSLDYAKQKAQEYDKTLQEVQKELNQAIDAYDRFVKTLPREYTGKKTNFGGHRRRIFKYPAEKPPYDLCCALWDKRKKLQKKYSNLLKRLMFFVVSLRLGEDINAISDELIIISKGYHQRWMVENGFKSIKGQFWIPTKKRSLKARFAYFTISSLLYNAWHYQRLARFKRKGQYSAQELRAIKSWKKTTDKRKMQELIRVESARAFLIETFGFGLKSLLKHQILT